MELWQAEAGSGKTEAAVALIAETVRARPLARVWVVLPNARQRTAVRERLLERLGDSPAALNIDLFNYYTLNRRLLALLRVPVRSLHGGARQAVLRRVAGRTRLSAYGPVAGMSGFAHAVGELISELKQAGIEPRDFADAARSQQDLDLAAIYDAYQTHLHRHGLVDTEGEAWLALQALQASPAFDPKLALLIVDGFDQFTAVQARLTKALDRLAERTVVTLTDVPGRDEGIGRRFVTARRALGDVPGVRPDTFPHTQPCVGHLLEHAFRVSAVPQTMPQDAAQTLTLVEAHSPSAEAAEVMRQVKRRLVVDGTAPDDVMIVVRDWSRYQPALSAAAREFGVPVALQSGAPLSRHPLAALLDALLSLPETGFAFEAVIDVLRSPYVRLDDMPPVLLSKVEQAARKYNLRAGRDAWEAALAAATRPGTDYRGEATAPILTEAEAKMASEALTRLFEALPQADEQGSMWHFVQRIEDFVGPDPDHPIDCDAARAECCLHIAANVRQSAALSDDLAALRAVNQVLKSLLLTEDLLDALSDWDGRTLTWVEFVADLRAAVAGAELSAGPDRSGRVLVTTATDARGSAHLHVYILGLSEGIFPAPLPSDPLYLDSERQQIQRNGAPLLRLAADRADDSSLFFELLAQARVSLTLTRPTMNGGQVWPSSPLWNGVVAHLTEDDFRARIMRIMPGRPPDAGRAASLPELAAALQQHDSLMHRTYLKTHDSRRAAHIANAQRVERARRQLASTGGCDDAYAHVADLTGPESASLGERLRSPAYRWSASALDTLGKCTYRLFAEKLLGLEALEDPAEGADAAVEGELMHFILELTYAHFRAPDRPIGPENLDDALERLHESAEIAFDYAQRERSLAPSAIWPQQQQVIVRYLRGLIERDFSPDSPVTQAFGGGKRWTLATEAHIGDTSGQPFVITIDTEAGPVRFPFTGKIDRIDCIYDGHTCRLVVIDYKRSGEVTTGGVAQGRNTQTVLYTTALEQVLNDPDAPERQRWFATLPDARVEVAGGMYWSIRGGRPLHVLSPGGRYRIDGASVDMHGLKGIGLANIAERLQRVRAGDFRPLPTKPRDGRCDSFCAFADLCRVCELIR